MWVEDLTKALWILNEQNDPKYLCCIQKIENGYIYTTVPGVQYSVAELVWMYDQEYNEPD